MSYDECSATIDGIMKYTEYVCAAQFDPINHCFNKWQVSNDACFKLTHRKRANHGGRNLVDQYEYFLNDSGMIIKSAEPSEPTCNNFNAVYGSVNTGKLKTNDITGLFGSVCSRHGTPISGTFQDIDKGEG